MWGWSEGKFSRHDIRFGKVGGNEESSAVVCSAGPQIIQPCGDIGSSNEVIEGTCRKVINPGKPRSR